MFEGVNNCLTAHKKVFNLTLHGIFEQRILDGGAKTPSSNSKNKSYGITKFGMLVGVHSGFLQTLLLS